MTSWRQSETGCCSGCWRCAINKQWKLKAMTNSTPTDTETGATEEVAGKGQGAGKKGVKASIHANQEPLKTADGFEAMPITHAANEIANIGTTKSRNFCLKNLPTAISKSGVTT